MQILRNIKSLFGNKYFKDKKNRNIYFRKIDNKAFIIRDADEKEFLILQNRLSIAVFAIFVLFAFKLEWYVPILAGISVYSYLQYKFNKFLSTKTDTALNYEPKSSDKEKSKSNSNFQYYVTISLYIAFTITLGIMAYMSEDLIIYLLLAASILFSFNRIYNLKKEHNQY